MKLGYVHFPSQMKGRMYLGKFDEQKKVKTTQRHHKKIIFISPRFEPEPLVFPAIA